MREVRTEAKHRSCPSKRNRKRKHAWPEGSMSGKEGRRGGGQWKERGMRRGQAVEGSQRNDFGFYLESEGKR